MFFVLFFFFKQKTAYEMRISDWSSDVCSSDLFNIDNAQRLDVRHIGSPAQRQQQAEGKSESNAKGSQYQRKRQASPAVVLDMSQAKHPTPHQDRDSKQGHHPDDAQEGPPEPAYATAYDHGNQDDAGQQRPPLLVVGVDTEQNQAVLFGDEGPAGATRDPAFLGVGGVEVGANEQPFDHGGNSHEHKPGNQHRQTEIGRAHV